MKRKKLLHWENLYRTGGYNTEGKDIVNMVKILFICHGQVMKRLLKALENQEFI